MCYDISFTTDMEEVAGYLPDIVPDGQLSLQFDATHIVGHAFGEHPIIYKNREDELLHCRLMEWGCIPFYVKEEKKYVKQRASMLNARSERILGDDKSYWYKIRNRRCLIPVTGIYEHRAIDGWKNKVPYYIRLKNQPVFFIPGLYSVAELVDTGTGEMIKKWTFALITRNANEVMSYIHNSGENKGRMPLMVPFDMALEFISDDLTPERYAEILHYELPSDEMEYHPVFTIRSPKLRPDQLKKNDFWKWENLPELGKSE